MSRTRVLSFIVLLLGLVACGESPAPPRTNVVVITIDTTRADALGAYGQPKPTSPRIDAMAAEGVLFQDVVTSAPSTLPSHATIFTGKQPFAHGVRANAGFRLADEHRTLAETLSEQGYVTHAEIAAPVLGATKRLDQGFQTYRDPAAVRDPVEVLDLENRYRRLTRPAEEITDAGLDFVRQNAGVPFLLWLHYFDPHKPYDPPEEFTAELADYHAEVRRVDTQVGRLIDTLDTLGLRERTLVVLTSDHGEGQSQHGELTHSYLVYESTMRVPLVFWGAGVPRAVRVRALVRTLDITPTVLASLGLSPLPDVQGVSLLPLFANPDENLNLVAYGESIESTLAFGSSVLRFVRVGRWKYVHKLHPELYDVRADPTEVQNQIENRVRVAARLRSKLEDVVASGPSATGASRVALDAQQVDELRALGYIAGEPQEATSERLDSLELVGPDPNERLVDVELFSKGWGLLQSEQWDSALLMAEGLLERDSTSHLGHSIRVEALERSGRDAEAVPALRDALAASPESVDHATALAGHLMRAHEWDEAEALLTGAIDRDPCASRARLLLSSIYQTQGRFAEQFALLDAADPLCPAPASVANALAYVLATSPDPALRDGARGLRVAQALVADDGGRHPGYLDTLAAAFAETGDFQRAVAEQERAVALLDDRVLPEGVRASFEQHLETYRSGLPLRLEAPR